MTIQTDNYGIGASGTASQKFTFTAPNDGTFKLGRGVLGAESSFPFVVNADDSISGVFSGLGVGQTWQNVTGSRVKGTTYTNSTGKPIQVACGFIMSSGLSATFTVGGVVVRQVTSGGAAWHDGVAGIIVPVGSTYSASGTATVDYWSELR